MCQFSEEAVCSRPAVQGELLVTWHWGLGFVGLASPFNLDLAVCVPAGTELEFTEPVEMACGAIVKGAHRLARVRYNADARNPHHRDVLEFPDGRTMCLTGLSCQQRCRVLQLPATPMAELESVVTA
jgi:hypothetical protein